MLFMSRFHTTCWKRAGSPWTGPASGSMTVSSRICLASAAGRTASIADCLRRNAARDGKARVPAVAIYVAARKLEAPSREEGFDEVYEARLEDDGSWSVIPIPSSQT